MCVNHASTVAPNFDRLTKHSEFDDNENNSSLKQRVKNLEDASKPHQKFTSDNNWLFARCCDFGIKAATITSTSITSETMM